MRIRGIAIVAAAVGFARVAPAQSVGKMLEDDFKNAGKDILSIWASPFDASGKDWLLTAAAFGAFGASMLADQSVSDWAIENDSSGFFRALKPVRRGGKLFSGKYVVPPVAAVYVIGIVLKNQDLRDFVTGCMSSWAAESFPRKGAAYLFGRARPDTLPDDPQNWKLGGGGDWMMRSFPAGHFANALACATYWNKRFHLGAAGPAVYALALAVGVGRLADRAHWTSDSVIGGILGYAVGKEIAQRAVDRNVKRLSGGGAGSASLNVTPDAGGVAISMRWTF
jgi:membrane-associated phospholipid phosphatase